MEETLTSEKDQSPAAAEEKGVYHLTSDLIMCFNHLVVWFSSFDFLFYIQHLEK